MREDEHKTGCAHAAVLTETSLRSLVVMDKMVLQMSEIAIIAFGYATCALSASSVQYKVLHANEAATGRLTSTSLRSVAKAMS